MINVKKQVAYWEKSSEEDWKAAGNLLKNKHIRHALFFVHLSLEKLLKAHVCSHINDLAPRIHNLVRLAESSGLIFTQDQIDILAEINSFNIEGRYPESLSKPPSFVEAKKYFSKAEEVLLWLRSQSLKK